MKTSTAPHCEDCGAAFGRDDITCPTCGNSVPRIGIPATDAPRIVRCRYLDRYVNRCTGEAVTAAGEILLCTRHLGLAMQLIERGAA